MKTPAQLRARAEELHKKAENLSHASSRAGQHAPGAYITGGSGRSRAQNRATARGLERTIRLAVASLETEKEAKYLEARAHAIETAPARAAAKEKRKEQERNERAIEAALPVLNDPSARVHMTWKEWANTPQDHRGFTVQGDHRVRTIVLDGGLRQVYLTGTPPKKTKGPFFVVETRADGFPWTEATLPNERAVLHRSPEVANANIRELKGYDDFWKHAEYRVVPANAEQIQAAYRKGLLPT